jgi:phosphohistidine phosphatase
MNLYVVRHGIAVLRGTAGYIDEERPLTDEGREKMAKAAEGMTNLISSLDLVLSSPLLRALETARIIAHAFKAENRLEVSKDLSPGGSMKNTLAAIAKQRALQSVMIVGHEPDLGFLASHLLGCDGSVIEFKKGAVCCIELPVVARGRGRIQWHLQPKLLRELS